MSQTDKGVLIFAEWFEAMEKLNSRDYKALMNAVYRYQLLGEEPPEFKSYLQYHLKLGESFPRARYEALQDMGADAELLSELVKPNNILAMEYLRSLRKFAPEIYPVPIERIGGGYNDVTGWA